MTEKYKRKTTRSRPWPETRAILEMTPPGTRSRQKPIKVTGKVIDIGSEGMFLRSDDFIPMQTNVGIKIYFGPRDRITDLEVTARGDIVRRSSKGVGIRFTSISLSHLQNCIISRMNLVSISNGRKRRSIDRKSTVEELQQNLYKLRDYKAP